MMNPEEMARSVRKMSISVHQLSSVKLEALHGDAKSTQRSGTLAKIESSHPFVSPLPLPEHIIQNIIDIFRFEKERELAVHASKDSLFTHRAIEHAHAFDADLKNLSLVSRLWTQPARHALGRKLVLIMDAKRLQSVEHAAESPLYGPWTQEVEILEMPYAPARDKEYADKIWAAAQRAVARLENVRSFTINSRILYFTAGKLDTLLSSLKNVEELAIWNTGPLLMPASLGEHFRLSLQCPSLRKIKFRRCLPTLRNVPMGGCSVRQSSDLAEKLLAINSLFFKPLNTCFGGVYASCAYNEEAAHWSVDDLRLTNTASHCSEGCRYEDISSVCTDVRYLNFSAQALSTSWACAVKALRNFTRLKAITLVFFEMPLQDVLDAVTGTAEDVEVLIAARTLAEFATLDEQFLRFIEARHSTLRRVSLSLNMGKQRDCKYFPLTLDICVKHAITLSVACDNPTSAS